MNTRKATEGARRSLASLAIIGAVAGLLIWSKLRVTTTVPRSAYAVPRHVEAHTPAHEAIKPAETRGQTPEGEPQPGTPDLANTLYD